MKERIEKLLLSTGRAGMEKLIDYMNNNGFFASPCSGQYHLAKEGGLVEHSYNVFCVASDLSFLLCKDAEPLSEKNTNALIICCLLHDIGKMGQFGKLGYVPNMIKDGRPTKAEPEQKYKQSADKPFKANPDLLYLDHEVRSVAIISRFIDLTEEEQQAILWHNGLYGSFKYQIPGKETPLYMILHFADMWASRVLEKEGCECEEV